MLVIDWLIASKDVEKLREIASDLNDEIQEASDQVIRKIL
jgi:hypothetical protein